nr:13710_t:CDS:2 [Entrophospora candida]
MKGCNIGGKDDIREWGMDNADWVKFCDIDFVERFNDPEPLKHFRGLAYYRRQVDLHKFYLTKQWEVVHNLVQLIGFRDINDTNILSGDDVAKAFKQSWEQIIKIQEDALLLFGFKSRAKETPNLNATVKLFNAIVGNWCGYAIKSKQKREGPKDQQVWKQIYWIDCKPYSGTGFNKVRALILPTYKPESVNEIQELFDSMPITDTNSKFTN